MSVKSKSAVDQKVGSIDRMQLGKLLLQILPGKSGQAKTEEFKEKLRKEFGKATELPGLGSRAEMERTANFLLAQLQEYGQFSSHSPGSSRKAGVHQSTHSSQRSASEKRKPPQSEPRSLYHFRFEHPAIITQRLRRLPEKSLEVELNKLSGDVARQVRFLIWQCGNGQMQGEEK